MIGRREFITLLGGAAAAWPVTARAQQTISLLVCITHELASDDYAYGPPWFNRDAFSGSHSPADRIVRSGRRRPTG